HGCWKPFLLSIALVSRRSSKMVCGFTLLTLAAFSSRATAHAATSSASELAGDFIHVNGQRLVAPGGGEFHIRAIGTGSTAADPSEKDYQEMARLKFNAVNRVS